LERQYAELYFGVCVAVIENIDTALVGLGTTALSIR